VPYTAKAKITPVKRNRSVHSNERASLERSAHSNLLTASKRKTLDGLRSTKDLLKDEKSPGVLSKCSRTTRPNLMHKQSESSLKREKCYTNMLLNQSNTKS